MQPTTLSTAAVALLAMATAASAATVEISITNNQAEDGLYLTPLFVALHDGSYNAFDVGGTASAGIEALAEGGDASGVIADAQAAGATTGVITSPGGFAGAPVIDPGETARIRISVDPTNGRYLTFLSMVIPSNDAFVGNANPFAYQLFDASGAFSNIGPIDVALTEVWDAGTEINDNQGAAFNTAGGTSSDEGGTVQLFGDISTLTDQNTADGTTIGSVLNASVATVSVAAVPVPASLPLLAAALGLAGFAARRRSKQS